MKVRGSIAVRHDAAAVGYKLRYKFRRSQVQNRGEFVPERKNGLFLAILRCCSGTNYQTEFVPKRTFCT